MKWLLVASIVFSTTVADMLMSLGMRKHGEIRDFSLKGVRAGLKMVIQNPLIMVAILALILSFLAFMALLSIADLSFAVPATAAIFVTETICAKTILKERVGWQRWTGAVFIACGVTLLSL